MPWLHTHKYSLNFLLTRQGETQLSRKAISIYLSGSVILPCWIMNSVISDYSLSYWLHLTSILTVNALPINVSTGVWDQNVNTGIWVDIIQCIVKTFQSQLFPLVWKSLILTINFFFYGICSSSTYQADPRHRISTWSRVSDAVKSREAVGAEDHSVKHLPHKHELQAWLPEPTQKLYMTMWTCNSTAVEAKTSGSLSNETALEPNEKPHLKTNEQTKNKVGGPEEQYLNLTSGLHFNLFLYTYATHIHV